MRIQYARKNSTQIEVLQGVNAETQKKKEEEREKRRRRKLAQRQAAAAAAAAAAGGAGAVVNGQAGVCHSLIQISINNLFMLSFFVQLRTLMRSHFDRPFGFHFPN